VTLWKRAPRSVYSVYGEQEYLSGGDLDAGEQESSPAIAYEPSSASRSTRLLGLGLLVGVILSAIALVALNASHPGAPSRGDIGRRAPVDQASAPVRPRSVTHARTLPGTYTRADELPAFRPVRREREHGGRFAARAQTATPSGAGRPDTTNGCRELPDTATAVRTLGLRRGRRADRWRVRFRALIAMSDSPVHAKVVVTPRPMWRIRLARELPRHLLQGLALAGMLASARFALAPPRPVIVRAPHPSAGLVDRAAEGFASLFARRYLTWDSSDPEAHRAALSQFLGSSMEAEGGLQLPEDGEQEVQWTQVVQARYDGDGERLYTIAAQTDTDGLVYLTVSVVRKAGRLALAGYPAFVGAPASGGAIGPRHLREVEDRSLETVSTRALRNYLGRAGSELAADLATGARVSLPSMALTLQTLVSLDWSADRRSVLAVVRAGDERGVDYTLSYELDVVTAAGRWEVSAIQMDPDV
jgi:hypothetical protein